MSTSKESLILPKLLSSEIVHDDFVKIRRDSLRFSDHEPYSYYVMQMKAPAVIILGTTKEGLFVLNEEYRHPTNQVLLGCPGGFLEENEDPLQGAQREFLEESGYTAARFSVVGKAFPYPGISEQLAYFVTAEEAVKIQEPVLDRSEVIRTVLLNKQELTAKIKLGVALDGILCSALFFFEISR